ncbi:MAG: permease [Deltaproteobacteria bacterium]|nr:permease [Deltaproteobacteria bacterium]
MENSPEKKKIKEESLLSIFLFLLTVTALYEVAFLLAPEKALAALGFGWKMLTRLFPVLLLVFLMMFLSNLFIKPRWVQNQLGRDSGFKGVLMAMVGGILSMGPVYVWYGILSNFRNKGMRPALIAVFLYTRSIKLPLLPLMVFFFFLPYTVVLSFYMLLFSLPNGLLTEQLTGNQKTMEEKYGSG